MGASKKQKQARRAVLAKPAVPTKLDPEPAKNDAVEQAGTAALERLRQLHQRLAIAYGLQALFVLVFLRASVMVTGASGQAVHELFRLPLAQVVALILAISAIFHGLQASYTRTDYQNHLKRGESPYRWLENAFSSSLLPVTIGLVAGMRDISSLAMLFVLGFVAHILGWQFERQLAAKRGQDARSSFVLLMAAGLTSWLAVGGYLLFSAAYGPGPSLNLTLAYGLTLLLALAYGWVLRQHERGVGRWSDYLYTERTFIMLSFAAKSVLTWQIFAITL